MYQVPIQQCLDHGQEKDDHDNIIYQCLFNFPHFGASIFKCNGSEFVLTK
jgi:hypothetical protein